MKSTWKCSACEQPIEDCECRGPKGSWRPTGGLAPDEPLPDGHPMKGKMDEPGRDTEHS